MSVAPPRPTMQQLATQLQSRVASALALYPDGHVEAALVGPTGWMEAVDTGDEAHLEHPVWLDLGNLARDLVQRVSGMEASQRTGPLRLKA